MSSRALREPWPLKAGLLTLAVGFVALLVGAPLVAVFAQALEGGVGPYLAALTTPDARSAVALTLLTAGVSVTANTLFGVLAAYALARYEFVGKRLVSALIELPFSVSPVVAGLLFVLLFGRQGVFGRLLEAHDLHIIFAVPGVILATTFVTFPFVAKELLPLLVAQGSEAEEAALTLGESGLRVFLRVTLPRARWGLLAGVALCNARAMGEFGAVSVVSGHVRGATVTLPLHVEILYHEYNLIGAFAAASVLTALAVVTLAVKRVVARRDERGSRAV